MIVRLLLLLCGVLFAGATASAAAVTADFEGGNDFGASYRVVKASGGPISGSIGTSSGSVPAIGGNSAFIDITRTDVTQEFGAGIRIDLTVAPGTFTSTNIADYSIAVDVALNGYQATQLAMFANFFDGNGDRLFAAQGAVNQNDALAGFPALTSGDGTVSLTAGLSEFAGLDVSNFATDISNVAGIRLQLNTVGFDPNSTQSLTPTLVVDNFGLFEVSAIPEPSSFAILGLIGTTLLVRRRPRLAQRDVVSMELSS